MRILIAGCGDVGTRLGLLWAAEGHEVYGLRRSPQKLPASIRGLAADLTDVKSLRRAGEAMGDGFAPDLLYYTAAASRSGNGSGEEAYRRAYVEGLRNALEVFGARTRRVLFTSSTGVYPQDEGEWVDESSPTVGDEGVEEGSYRGRLLLEGEGLLRAWSREQGRGSGGAGSAVVLRLAGIYGPGRTRLLDSVRGGDATCYDDPPRYTNRIHADDCAGVLYHLGLLTEPAPVYIGVDHAPAPDCEVKRWLARRLGVPEPSHRSSSGPLAASSHLQGQNKRCSNRRLLASGYRFLYPDYRAGYEALLGVVPGAPPSGAPPSGMSTG